MIGPQSKDPQEFGLLTKQVVYLNRYISTLAPGLNVFADDVLSKGIGDIGGGDAPVVDMPTPLGSSDTGGVAQ